MLGHHTHFGIKDRINIKILGEKGLYELNEY